MHLGLSPPSLSVLPSTSQLGEANLAPLSIPAMHPRRLRFSIPSSHASAPPTSSYRAQYTPALTSSHRPAPSLLLTHQAEMLWLNSNYPLNKDPSQPGIARGECAQDSGKPSYVQATHPNASVTFSNIKYGPLNSTF